MIQIRKRLLNELTRYKEKLIDNNYLKKKVKNLIERCIRRLLCMHRKIAKNMKQISPIVSEETGMRNI